MKKVRDEKVETKCIGRQAFDVIYEENASIVYETALYYTGSHYAAEEITQNVFVKLYTVMEHVNLNAVRGWLIVTAKNMSLNVKRNGKREILTDEIWETEGEQSAENEFISKLREKEIRDLASNIFEALYRRNQRWYEAITLCYILEKPQREVAEHMGITLEGLHSMLHRAKNWVRDNYQEEFHRLNKA